MPYLDPKPSLPFVDWDTSRDAAVAIQPFASSQRERIYEFIAFTRSFGATDKDIKAALGIQRASICPRRRELMAEGRVVKTERTRKNCAVYVSIGGRS